MPKKTLAIKSTLDTKHVQRESGKMINILLGTIQYFRELCQKKPQVQILFWRTYFSKPNLNLSFVRIRIWLCDEGYLRPYSHETQYCDKKTKWFPFESMLQTWQSYCKDNNMTIIPKAETNLSGWVRDTRKAYKQYINNEPSTMTKKREELLKAAKKTFVRKRHA